MSIGIVIPWMDRGDPDRKAAFDYVWESYSALTPTWIGDYVDDGGPLNRSRMRNQGARRALLSPEVDVLAFIDADCIVPAEQLLAAAEAVRREGRGACFPFDRFRTSLSPKHTRDLYAGYAPLRPDGDEPSYDTLPDGTVPEYHLAGPAVVVRAAVYMAVGGFDEGYLGWGEEDWDFLIAVSRFGGGVRTVPGHHFGLWHEPVANMAFTGGTDEHALYQLNVARRAAKQAHVRSCSQWAGINYASRRHA